MFAKFFLAVPVGTIILLCSRLPVSADTVLYDFETGPQGWCSFGAVTTDSSCSSGVIPGENGQAYFHTGDFDFPDESSFGMVDVSPTTGPLRDLSAFEGISIDALFRDVSGFPPYEGTRELYVIVATGFDAGEEEFFAPPVVLTDTFETYTFAFADFESALTLLPPTTEDLSDVTIKLVMYNEDGTGTGELNFDQIIGLDEIASAENADFNNDGDVDGRDFLIWQRNTGTGTMLSEGDANNSGTVDGADLAIWETQYGTSVALGDSISAVPEPGMLSLGLFASALLTGLRLRR